MLAATVGIASSAPYRLPIGEARLDIDAPQIDETLGVAFVPGVRSAANNCYVQALSRKPDQEGVIGFVVKPPPGEGRFVVTVTPTGTLDAELVACVRRVFDMYYHYADKTPFDAVPGTLTFHPKTVEAPPLPSDGARRAAVDAQYADSKVVRVADAVEQDASLDVDSSNEVFARYGYAVDLVFASDGYESVCTHYEAYKVFTSGPYQNPYAGHRCTSAAHKAGDHVSDRPRLTYSLKLWPQVGATWELHASGITGTRPVERQH